MGLTIANGAAKSIVELMSALRERIAVALMTHQWGNKLVTKERHSETAHLLMLRPKKDQWSRANSKQTANAKNNKHDPPT